MTDKTLSERVAEVLARHIKRLDFLGVVTPLEADMARIISEQQALIGEWERKAANWFASPEAAQQLDGYRELAMRAYEALEERDRLRAENEALRADAERYRWLRDVGCARTIQPQSFTEQPGKGPFMTLLMPGVRPSSMIISGPCLTWDNIIDAARSQS